NCVASARTKVTDAVTPEPEYATGVPQPVSVLVKEELMETASTHNARLSGLVGLETVAVNFTDVELFHAPVDKAVSSTFCWARSVGSSGGVNSEAEIMSVLKLTPPELAVCIPRK